MEDGGDPGRACVGSSVIRDDDGKVAVAGYGGVRMREKKSGWRRSRRRRGRDRDAQISARAGEEDPSVHRR